MIIKLNFQFKQLERRSLKKIRASMGFEPVTSAKYWYDALPIELRSYEGNLVLLANKGTKYFVFLLPTCTICNVVSGILNTFF